MANIFQQQRPLVNGASVRSAPSQPHGAPTDVWRTAALKRQAEEKTFKPDIAR